MMGETVVCTVCGGTGRVSRAACREIVKGRPCRYPVVDDPEMRRVAPDLADLQGYCGWHFNARARERRRAARKEAG